MVSMVDGDEFDPAAEEEGSPDTGGAIAAFAFFTLAVWHHLATSNPIVSFIWSFFNGFD